MSVKKISSLCCALLLALSLSACSGGEEGTQPYDLDLVDQLAQCGAFSEELEPLDGDVLWGLYRLESAGLTREQLTGAAALRSAGATCEEAAVLQFSDEQAAQTALQAMEDYVQSQIQSNTDYRPKEIPKLESALVEQRGASVLLVVANDLDAAQSVLP